MSISRPLAALAGAGVLGIALVGVGAGASFTSETKSSQKVTAGTMKVQLSASGASAVNGDPSAIMLPAVGPVGSTFETAATEVTITNTGNIDAVFDAIQMSAVADDNDASRWLLAETNVCIKGSDKSGGPWVEGNGPLSVATSLNPTVKQNPVVLKPGETASYSVSFYAGKDSSCGTVYSIGSETAKAWKAANGDRDYATPASLGNEAQGGSVTPTLHFSFTG